MDPRSPEPPSFRRAFLFWLKLGFVNFGGPTGQIAMLHRELVERRRWISEERFLHALNYCMLLPGPEATQLAIYVGYLLHKWRGGLAAGVLFVLPSVFALLALSWLYAAYGTVPVVAAVFVGLKAVVLAIVAHAVIKIGRRALRAWWLVALAALAFASLAFFAVPFPLVVLSAGLVGLAVWRFAPRWMPARPAAGTGGSAVLADDASTPEHAKPRARRFALVAGVGALLWLAPLALLVALPGPSGVFLQQGLFFSLAALVTFGGAYAVLTYLAQAAVVKYGWLTAAQMIDGLGLAETTPGPLIMVVAFVGFLGGWNLHGALPPGLAGTLGLLVAVYFTFLPSFLFVFLGAPSIERLRGNRAASAALTAITAAVVGVILNLALFFGEHVVLANGAVAWFPVALGLVAFVALTIWDLEVAWVVLGGAAAGLAWWALGLGA